MCSIALACSLPDQHGKVLGCDVYAEDLSAVEQPLVLASFSLALRPKSDFSRIVEVRAAVKAIKHQTDALLARKEGTA